MKLPRGCPPPPSSSPLSPQPCWFQKPPSLFLSLSLLCVCFLCIGYELCCKCFLGFVYQAPVLASIAGVPRGSPVSQTDATGNSRCPDFIRGHACVGASVERAGAPGRLLAWVGAACPPGAGFAAVCRDASYALGLLKSLQKHSHREFTLCWNPRLLNRT